MTAADALRFISSLARSTGRPAISTTADLLSQHADLIGSLVDLIACGACTDSVDLAIQNALIAASDAQMEAEFPGQK